MRLGRGLRGLGINAGIGAAVGAIAGGTTALADDRDFFGGVTTGALVGAGAGAGYTAISRVRNINARKALVGARRELRGDLKSAEKLYGGYGLNQQTGLSGWSNRRAMRRYSSNVNDRVKQIRMASASLRGTRPSMFAAGLAGGTLATGVAYATLPSNLSVNFRDASLRQRLQYDTAKAALWRSRIG